MHIQNQNTPDSVNGVQLIAEENAVCSMLAMQTYKDNTEFYKKSKRKKLCNVNFEIQFKM
jgi:hypothetical protein